MPLCRINESQSGVWESIWWALLLVNWESWVILANWYIFRISWSWRMRINLPSGSWVVRFSRSMILLLRHFYVRTTTRAVNQSKTPKCPNYRKTATTMSHNPVEHVQLLQHTHALLNKSQLPLISHNLASVAQCAPEKPQND